MIGFESDLYGAFSTAGCAVLVERILSLWYDSGMLEMRRIIELSSRVHTYLVLLYMFFAFLFVLFLYFPVREELVTLITSVQMIMGWTIFLVGVWIVFASVLCSVFSRVWVISPAVKTMVRFLAYFVISITLDTLNTLITGGFSYGM